MSDVSKLAKPLGEELGIVVGMGGARWGGGSPKLPVLIHWDTRKGSGKVAAGVKICGFSCLFYIRKSLRLQSETMMSSGK